MATRVEAIDSSTSRATANSRARLRERYEQAKEQILERANYLKQVAEGLRILEIEKTRNVEYFARVSQKSGRNR